VGGSIISGFCKCGCCCESNNSCCHSGAAGQFVRQPSGRSDRSSPSGQSDHTSASETAQTHFTKAKAIDSSTLGSRKSYTSNERRSARGGVARAVRAKIEEEKEREVEESDSALSEEQFKCWEYMLEQNTQLLFDKELNTISRAFTKKPQSNLVRSHLRSMSTSSPQLVHMNDAKLDGMSNLHNMRTASISNVPFLSKHFGSARTFLPSQQNFFKPIRYSSGKTINSGPNAAYFGSLQRLMPYNLECDFTAAHEKRLQEIEAFDPEGVRMRQYWGVATTEL
jgi:PH domain and leucine-rich repeat-containing protein phosphatase